MNKRKMQELIKSIYHSAMSAVNGQNLIKANIHPDTNKLIIRDRSIPINKGFYLIGFGKAVLGMAEEIEKMFHPKLVRGVLSVPVGSVETLRPCFHEHSKIEVRECARNNLPDEDACINTQLIGNLVKNLTKDDVILVLISGGGSACLSSPKSPLTLEEKLGTIKELVKSGANIKELNSVRKKLSSVKGGQLSCLAYPATVVTLIISDVVGDPLQDIASGPTVLNEDVGTRARDIVHKYGLEHKVSPNVLQILTQDTPLADKKYFENVHNFILGNNRSALKSAKKKAESSGYSTVVLSSEVEGLGDDVCKRYVDLLQYIMNMRQIQRSRENHPELQHIKASLENILSDFHTSDATLEELVRILQSPEQMKLCVINGGEITWNMNNRAIGTGGRNLHLTLLFQYELRQLLARVPNNGLHVWFCSAGTDGIDGLTDVAGSITHDQMLDSGLEQAKKCLDTFDSYNYYRDKMEYVVKPGHTGTNVMDIHILLVEE